jgi:hypothetical protein
MLVVGLERAGLVDVFSYFLYGARNTYQLGPVPEEAMGRSWKPAAVPHLGLQVGQCLKDDE